MTDIITFRHRGSDTIESYDCTNLPEGIWHPLALVGIKTLLTAAKDRVELHRQLMAGEFSRGPRAERNSDWKTAVLAVKAKKLKKEGHPDPDTGASEWWVNLSPKDRQKMKALPEVVIQYTKITGKALPEI